MTEQMELPLWETLRSAQMVPEQVDFEGLLAQVEQAVSQVPESEQLRLAGEAFLRMAEVYAARSETWIEEWEQSSRDAVVERGFFDDLVRQTMAVDLSELMEPAPPRKQRSKRDLRQEGSIVAAVEKEAVLAMVDQMESEAVRKEEVLAMVDHLESEAALEEERKQQVLQIAHDEDVSRWIEAIAQWLIAIPSHCTSFAHLCQSLGMPKVEIWLGVLLGEFELEQDEDFYSDMFWIKGTPADS